MSEEKSANVGEFEFPDISDVDITKEMPQESRNKWAFSIKKGNMDNFEFNRALRRAHDYNNKLT